MKMNLRFALIATLLFTFFGATPSDAQLRQHPLPAIYFDLGDVLIFTKEPQGFRFTRGAQAYIYGLSDRGYKLRLITNIPETWGRNHAEKFEALKLYIAKTWREKAPFPWELFDIVILPPNDQLRKPHPHMFIEAMKSAGPCRPVYQGEDVEELKVARELGFLGYLVSASLTHDNAPFAPISELYCRPYNANTAFRRFMFSKRGF